MVIQIPKWDLRAFDSSGHEIKPGPYRTPEFNFVYFTGKSLERGLKWQAVFLGDVTRGRVGYVSRNDCLKLRKVSPEALPKLPSTPRQVLSHLYDLKQSVGSKYLDLHSRFDEKVRLFGLYW